MAITIRDHVRNLNYVQCAAASTLEDLEKKSRGEILQYHLDFSLICSALFRKVSPGSGSFLHVLKNPVNRIINGATKEDRLYKLAITGATLIEFYDQLNHQIEWIEERAHGVLSKLKDRYLQNPMENELAKIASVREDLELFTTQGYERQILAPVNKLLKWIDSGAIVGVGDLVDTRVKDSLRSKKDLFATLVEKQKNHRLPKEKKRSEENSIFHYSIDAINICITHAIAETADSPVYFVTPTHFNLQGCVIEENSFARRDRVPLFLLNLDVLDRNNDIHDQTEYLEEALKESSEMLGKVSRYRTLSEMPSYLDARLEKFYEIYMGPLFMATAEEDASISKEWHQVESVLSCDSKMKEILETAASDLRHGAQVVNMIEDRFDTSYMDEFEFDDDPVLKRVKKNLGLR